MGCVFFDLAAKQIGTLEVAGTETAAAVDLLTDTLHVAAGVAVLPLFTGAALTGTYRTGIIVRDAFPSFGWLRVEGPFASVVVKVYGDGVLRHTATVTSNEPVRLPAGRYREWEIEVVGGSRATHVVLATTSAELVRT